MQSCLSPDHAAVSSWSASAPLWDACRQLGAKRGELRWGWQSLQSSWAESSSCICEAGTQSGMLFAKVMNSPGEGPEQPATQDRQLVSLCCFPSKPSLLCKAHLGSVPTQAGELFSSYREPLWSLESVTAGLQVPLQDYCVVHTTYVRTSKGYSSHTHAIRLPWLEH